MIKIYCTKKLESFVNVEHEDKTEFQESENNWNGQLISIDRRKCLYFVHKKTLYSFVIFNILKKDLKNLDILLYEAFENQLKSDKIYDDKAERYLNIHFNGYKLLRTDNDQKTLGILRDSIFRIESYYYDKVDKLKSAKTYVNLYLNEIPLTSKKYRNAKDTMFEEINNHA
jgi:hypothetical protein